MKPQKVQPLKLAQHVMFQYDEEAGAFPENLAGAPLKRKVPRVLMVSPEKEEVLPERIADAIPNLRVVHRVKDVPKKGFHFIIVVVPSDIEAIRKICPKAIIIGANGSDKYGKEKDYKKAGADGYWWAWDPFDMRKLIERI